MFEAVGVTAGGGAGETRGLAISSVGIVCVIKERALVLREYSRRRARVRRIIRERRGTGIVGSSGGEERVRCRWTCEPLRYLSIKNIKQL